MFWNLIDRALARRHPRASEEEVRAEVEARHDAIGDGLVRRFSRGNVNLKRGAFLMKEDLEKRHRPSEK
jgi:hypothetical protein